MRPTRKIPFVYLVLTCILLVLGVGACATASPTPTPPIVLGNQTALPPTAPPGVQPTGVPSPAVENQPSPPPSTTAAPTATAPTAVAPTPPLAPTEALEPTNAPPPTAVAPAAGAPNDFFGVSTNGELLYDEQLRALATLGGVQMVRTSVNWGNIEKTRGQYNWKAADDNLETLLDNNLTPLVLVLNNAEWASNSPCGPVNDLVAFEQFIQQLVAHQPRVRYWVMYNEPDNSHYPDHVAGGCFGGGDINGNGKPDVHDYAEQLRVARRAVHQGNPDAQLVVGALALDNFDEASAPAGYPGGGRGGVFNARFLPELLQYMQANPLPAGEKYFDVLSFNYYDIYGPYWQNQAEGIGIAAKTNAVRKMLNDAALQAPLMVGETGEDSFTLGNEGQSENGVKILLRALTSNLTHVVWWTFQDFSDSAPPPSNTWKYGLVDQGNHPKPMYAAYQTASKQLTGATFVQPLQVAGGEGYLFNRDGAGIGVVWSSSDTPVTIAFAANVLQVTDLYGASQVIADGTARDVDGTVGRIGVQVDKRPLYIQAVQ